MFPMPSQGFMDNNQIVTGDCIELMRAIPAGSVDLVFVDPPYNIGKAEWDKIDNYLEWCAEWIAECSRVLKPNGAFWISHSKPLVLAQLSGLVEGRGLRNWITWDKYNGNPFVQAAGTSLQAKTNYHFLRSWQWMTEYLIYHADEGEWTSQCDKESGFIFEPLRAYLAGERDKAGFTTRRVAEEFQKKTGSRTVTGMAGHWLERVQWCLPTKENYQWLRSLFNRDGSEYLKREYEDLRAEFENLRYTFNNPGKMSSVWQIAPAKVNFHATPKPEELMRRIIEATSNEGDLVLDPMCGSGTTALVASRLSRNYIAFEIDPDMAELARERVLSAQPPLFAPGVT